VLEGGRIESREILLRPGKDGVLESEFVSDANGAGYGPCDLGNVVRRHWFFSLCCQFYCFRRGRRSLF
jgi:hypothetical protein